MTEKERQISQLRQRYLLSPPAARVIIAAQIAALEAEPDD